MISELPICEKELAFLHEGVAESGDNDKFVASSFELLVLIFKYAK